MKQAVSILLAVFLLSAMTGTGFAQATYYLSNRRLESDTGYPAPCPEDLFDEWWQEPDQASNPNVNPGTGR